MQGNGWIKLHREIQQHWIFQRDDYLKAWVLLLIKANHSDFKTLVSDKISEVVLIKRGEVVSSLKKLSIELKWSPSKVKRFITKLEKDKMIHLKNERRWTHLTILNYETYQYKRNADEPLTNRKRTADEYNQRKDKNDNKKKNLSQKEQLQGIQNLLKEKSKKFAGINVGFEFERMKDWLKATGKQYKNYNAFFNNWLRKVKTDQVEGMGEDEKIFYAYKCDLCKKVHDKSEFRDLFITCCETEIQPIKEWK